jgi:photosystem II stability/assembly factor-like uncharacterized protein
LTVAALLITAGNALSCQDTVDFRYLVWYDTVIITGYTGSLKDISIPAMIEKLPVTAIRDSAFEKNELSSVSIPANLDMAEDSFPGNLAEVYTRGGKSAGAYTSDDGGETWTRYKEDEEPSAER